MVIQRRVQVSVEPRFELRTVLFSHGWIDLAPFRWDETCHRFSAAFEIDGVAVDLQLRQAGRKLVATVASERPLSARRVQKIRRLLPYMLRLDEDLAGFWAICQTVPRLSWVARRRAGRIFRGASVFEDLIKLLFTTNCSWAATRKMCQRLVDALGRPAPSGRRAFPGPTICADQDEDFYRRVVRVGYRAKSCLALARGFATGELTDAQFSDRSLVLPQVRERLLALPGFGPYAAGQAMRTLGHYKDLALDSWCRARLAAMAGRRRPPADSTIQRRYAAFDPYDGLALWMDLTAEWFGEAPPPSAGRPE